VIPQYAVFGTEGDDNAPSVPYEVQEDLDVAASTMEVYQDGSDDVYIGHRTLQFSAAAITAAADRRKSEASEPAPLPSMAPPVVVETQVASLGSVVVWLWQLPVMPNAADLEGMTDTEAEKVALLESWCGRVLNEYNNRRHT
jgi:hypothetical protein